MMFYMVIMAILIGTNFSRSGCGSESKYSILSYILFCLISIDISLMRKFCIKLHASFILSSRSGESQTVVECGFGDNYVNRVVTEDEEDEREDVASV